MTILSVNDARKSAKRKRNFAFVLAYLCLLVYIWALSPLNTWLIVSSVVASGVAAFAFLLASNAYDEAYDDLGASRLAVMSSYMAVITVANIIVLGEHLLL